MPIVLGVGSLPDGKSPDHDTVCFIPAHGSQSLTWPIPVVTQLADLFWNLEYCEDPAVKPTIELAKLALVTSKDEEEEEVDKAGTDSSNDTDVTLVEDGSTRVIAPSAETMTASPIQASFSILGKRSRGAGSKMDIDTPDTDKDKDYVIVSKPGTPSQSPAELPPDSQTTTGSDIEMSEVEKARPVAPVRKGTTGMMFGTTKRDSRTTFTDRAVQAGNTTFPSAWTLVFSSSNARN